MGAVFTPPVGYITQNQARQKLNGSGFTVFGLVKSGDVSAHQATVEYVNRKAGTTTTKQHTFYPSDEIEKILNLLSAYPLNTTQTAYRLRLGSHTVARYAEAGSIEHIVVGGQKRFSIASVIYINRMRKIFTLTIEQVKKELGTNHRHLHAWTKAGRLDFFRLGRAVYYRPDQVESLSRSLSGYTTRGVAELLGISTKPILRLGNTGQLVYTLDKRGRRRYSVNDIHRLRAMCIGYTLTEAASLLGLKTDTVSQRAQQGKLRFEHDISGHRRYNRAQIDRLAAANKAKATTRAQEAAPVT